MFCIYCKAREADGKEHYIPQCLGRFENFEPLLDRLCTTCNNEIGGEIDREFCRKSPEAILRSIHWIKGQQRGGQKKRPPAHIYQPEKIGGRHIYMFGLDMDGRNILWQTGEQPGTAKEISQVVILDDADNAVEHIAIPTEISTGRELVEILFKKRNATLIGKAILIAASGDEERVQALFSEIDCNIPMQRRKGGPIPLQSFKVEITPAYFRALAKIGFHYALKYIPTITGNESEFRELRDFIFKGTGEASHFISSFETASNPSGPPGHLLTAVAAPEGPIVINMQFFAGCNSILPQWRLILGDNPTVLFLERAQMSAHFFSYSQRDDGQLIGGEIVRLSPSLRVGG